MPRVEFDTETTLPPERIVAMLTDFSPSRPEVWPGLWEGAYETYSVGDTSAEVREGNKTPKIWARERYDWSQPGVVRWTVIESNFCVPGSFVEARLAPRDGGGTRVHVTWERTPTTFGARLMAAMIVLTKGAPVKASLTAAFKKAGAVS
jgi:hypothetical protein